MTTVPTLPQAGREYLDLVSEELRHGGAGVATILVQDPGRWLSALGAILHDVQTQREERERLYEMSMRQPRRPLAWAETEANHRTWSRKNAKFEAVVRTRISQVRRLVPSDDLVALLQAGVLLNPRDRAGIRAWQDQAAHALSLRAQPTKAPPTIRVADSALPGLDGIEDAEDDAEPEKTEAPEPEAPKG